MENVRRASCTAAVMLASAGLIAAGPAPMAPSVQQAAVALTSDYTILPYPYPLPGPGAADLWTALETNLALAESELQQGVSDLLGLDLIGAAGNFSSAVGNIFPAIPENIVLATVGGLLGQDIASYLAYAGDFDLPSALDWSTLIPSVTELAQAGLYELIASGQQFFAGEIADGLYHAFAGLDNLFFQLPAVVFLGVPALAADSLLDLIGL